YAFEPFQLEERKEQEEAEEELAEHEFAEREEEQETTLQFELFGRKDYQKEKAKKQGEQEEAYSQRDE
ncbi:stage VI sporulation protein D, partial [Bacillus cereus]